MQAKSGPNRLRIIGGRWRGRTLRFPNATGLRPTPDRVRETLFNWLMPVIDGARCLDLFAGSGALGLEAASRGAAEVVLVERDRRVAQWLRDQVAVLAAEGVSVVQADAFTYLNQAPRPFDIVFLDPPYRKGLIERSVQALEQGGWLAPGAHIYLEAEHELGVPPVPAGWEVLRSKQTGDVGYHLARRSA